jgi:hypothetical protein
VSTIVPLTDPEILFFAFPGMLFCEMAEKQAVSKRKTVVKLLNFGNLDLYFREQNPRLDYNYVIKFVGGAKEIPEIISLTND